MIDFCLVACYHCIIMKTEVENRRIKNIVKYVIDRNKHIRYTKRSVS
jgi:hypothetical protein